MKRLEENNKGFLLVTHRTDELRRVHQVFVMKNGSFIESGDPRVLEADLTSNYSRVLRAYTRTFSGHTTVSDDTSRVTQKVIPKVIYD